METLFGDFESLAALLRAPQLRDVVRLVEHAGRPDLSVCAADAPPDDDAAPVLRALGLYDRYGALLARSRVGLAALRRARDDDLAALGLPKGPRVQLLAWAARA